MSESNASVRSLVGKIARKVDTCLAAARRDFVHPTTVLVSHRTLDPINQGAA